MDNGYSHRITDLRKQLSTLTEQLDSSEKMPASKCKQLTLSLKEVISLAKELQDDINEDSRKAEDISKGLEFDMTSCEKRLKHLRAELDKANTGIEQKEELVQQKLATLEGTRTRAEEMHQGLEGIDEEENKLRDQCRSEKQNLDRAEIAVEGLNRSLQALQFRMDRIKSRRMTAEEKLGRYGDDTDGAKLSKRAPNDNDSESQQGNFEEAETSMNELIDKLAKIMRRWEELERRKKFLQLQIDRVQEITDNIKTKVSDIDAQL
ncbi:hypothetical protein TrispH2_010402 [Trichoplax sp. H2]|uniref:Uncharacterized protein n=1 Tax=Trichoplax adhaerens TaxID=10228 RepID=B3S747_TRIAD|nr:hypothetical protein TRIADDRAFT_60038 [Trichoplax adhaerens]EDV21417.1 hypothetical protein TRIADDRAFT_60038 [Trichoplax adhaerens]RDD37708.1 hypothetical protein TrispH2_010402 [Trichoplax sp. H2]|eukprot:XP_002116017.1 hypothetical protein TRIADDRAFT_60038 [Trichoplax adhaerens]